MNEKLWFPGGEPNVTADDLNRDSNANNRAFQNALKAWLLGYNENFIISGCDVVITPGVEAVITEGYIFLNNEILQVDAQTVAFVSTDIYYYEKEITYDPLGDKIYNDAVPHQTWRKNRGKLVNSAVDPVPQDKCNAHGANWSEKVRNSITGEFAHFTPGNYDLTEAYTLNYLRFDLSGSAGTFRVDVPDADDLVHAVDVNHFFFYESDPNQPRCTYVFYTASGTPIASVNTPEYSIIMSSGGAWVEAVHIDLDYPVPDPQLIEIIIGSWNMKGTAIFTVPHGQMSKDHIKEITARIYNDTGDICYDLSSGKGLIAWDNADIILSSTGSFFSSNDFDGVGFDRGKIYIQI